MEHFTSDQLKKYEDILNQIAEEQKKSENLLQQTQLLDSRISAIALSSQKNLIKDKAFRCLAKVFHSVFEAYDLISDKISRYELERATQCKGMKYLFVEIYVAQSFQNKIIRQNWLITATIRRSREHINKSVNVKSKITNPICMLIPFADTIESAILEVTIAWPEGSNWPYVKIAEIPLDISFHFSSSTNSSISLDKKVMDLAKLYGRNVVDQPIQPLSSNLFCDVDIDVFLEAILKNSYHNLNPHQQSAFSRVNDFLTVKMTSGPGCDIILKLNKAESKLSIQAESGVMHQLKKYFIKELSTQPNVFKQNTLKSLQQWEEALKSDDDEDDFRTLRNVYSDLRQLSM